MDYAKPLLHCYRRNLPVDVLSALSISGVCVYVCVCNRERESTNYVPGTGLKRGSPSYHSLN